MMLLRRAQRRPSLSAVRHLCHANAPGGGPNAARDGASGPDTSRNYDIKQYEGLWHMLSREHAWPYTQTIAVLGPVGSDFQRAVEECCGAASGCSIIETSTEAKTRWQSVRVTVCCDSPDDFCELHFRLGGVHDVKAVV